jgi:hypothetical protein
VTETTTLTNADLRGLARTAVAEVPVDHHAGVKLPALKSLHEATGLSLRECVPLIDWALNRPITLTRAQKQRAVAEVTDRLTVTAGGYQRNRATVCAEDSARRLRRQHAALVRLAMARTVD